MCFAAAAGAEFRANAFGAKGDGSAVNTAAIQKAIDAAAARGGVVTFNRGVYLSGAVFLKSGVELRLDEGVELRGVHELAAYPLIETRVAGIEMKWPAALVNVIGQSKVRISGKGTLDGDGKPWWDLYWTMRKDYEARILRWAVDYDCQRPRLVLIQNSSQVDVEGVTMTRSGFWTLHICYSRQVHADGVIIRNNVGGHGPSTDGIDIDSSSDVLVERCDIDCNDDALCLKAGRDADGLRVNRPTEKVVIRDCTIRAGAAGVTIGSETSGGFRDIEAYRLKVLAAVPFGVLFKSANTRGGLIERINIHDLDLDGVATPVSVNLNWNPSYSYATLPEGLADVPAHWKVLTTKVSPERGLPHFRQVRIAGVKARGARQAVVANGYADAPLEAFELSDFDIESRTAGSVKNAARWKFKGLRIQTADGSRLDVTGCRDCTGLER